MNAKNIPIPAIGAFIIHADKILTIMRRMSSEDMTMKITLFNGDCKHYLLDSVTLTLEANNGVGKVCIHTHAWPEAK